MCQYCVEDRDGYVNALEKAKGSATLFIAMKNGRAVLISSGRNRFVETYIDFCPKCGRKLNIVDKKMKVKCVSNDHCNTNFKVGSEYEYNPTIGIRCELGDIWVHFSDYNRPKVDAKEFDFAMCRFEVVQ